MCWHMLTIIVTNAFMKGCIESLKFIFNCGPKFRVLLKTFSLNLFEFPCEESIDFQNRPSLAITQQDQRHTSAARESTSNIRVPVCQHLSLSGLYYLSSRFPFQTYTSSHSWPCCLWPPSAEFKSVSCKTRGVYSLLLIIVSEVCSL